MFRNKDCQLFVLTRKNIWYYWKSYKKRKHAEQAAKDIYPDINKYFVNLFKIEDSGGVHIFKIERGKDEP